MKNGPSLTLFGLFGFFIVIVCTWATMAPKSKNLRWIDTNATFSETASKISFSLFDMDKKIVLKVVGKCEDGDFECRYDVRDDLLVVMKKDQKSNKSIEVGLSMKNEDIDPKAFESFLDVCRAVTHVVDPDLGFISAPRFEKDIRDMTMILGRDGFHEWRLGLDYSGKIVKTDSGVVYTCRVSTARVSMAP